MNNYIFDYQNENDFRKRERTLKKYNMLAYKKLVFGIYPELKNGNFLGKKYLFKRKIILKHIQLNYQQMICL